MEVIAKLKPGITFWTTRYLSVVIKAVATESPSELSTATTTTTGAAAAGTDVVVELEMDELNRHECMSSLISVLHHMRLKGITPNVQRVTISL